MQSELAEPILLQKRLLRSSMMFAVAPMLSGLGMIMAGIAVVRAGTWSGVRRLLPLLVGVSILVPATPVMIITGGPPDLLALAVIVYDTAPIRGDFELAKRNGKP